MCPNSCLTYTGPLRDKESCQHCGEPRFDATTGEPRRGLFTIPIRRSEQLLQELRKNGEIGIIDDIPCGTDILLAVDRGDINPDDTVLMFSFDGAQIYHLRFKKHLIVPSSITPGLNKIKIVESCLFPSLHHVAAINKLDGLPVWNAAKRSLQKSKLYIVLATADGPARLHNYNITGCDHDDVPAHIVNPVDPKKYQESLKHVLNARTQAEYEYERRKTGICKPSIFSGLPPNSYLSILNMFPIDIMHLILNLADLLINLWHSKIECSKTSDSVQNWLWAVLVNDAWQIHAADIVQATPYLPGSFDQPPCNPAEKISSGYKAWEFLLYIFALGPGYFYGLLPDPFW
ncbi:hypothetical protein H0H92_016147 [Tricholoma furcatifolium]|nr:hypothetical protein H0H92_016147 [Tricholoma furcatifolium]